MEKQKLTTITIIALLVLNLGTLGFLFLSGSKRGDFQMPPHGRLQPRELIIEQLNFDTKQQADYEVLIQDHRNKIDAVENNIRNTKNELYLLLNAKTINITLKDSLIQLLANDQKEIEKIHFDHFAEIKKLCKKEQLTEFEDLTEELARLFSKPPRPRHD